MRFENKIAIITGGNGDIGLTTAKFLASEGATVIATTSKPIEKKELGIEFKFCNQLDVKNIIAFAENFPQTATIDYLILNAGIARFSKVKYMSEAEFDLVLDTNLKGNLFFAKYLIPKMNAEGAIVFIGSVARKMAIPGTAAYAASKAGLYAATKVLANELNERRIRVNMISPGIIDTGMYLKFGLPKEKAEEIKETLVSKLRNKEMGKISDVVEMIGYLLSDKAKYITGQEFIIDNGMATAD